MLKLLKNKTFKDTINVFNKKTVVRIYYPKNSILKGEYADDWVEGPGYVIWAKALRKNAEYPDTITMYIAKKEGDKIFKTVDNNEYIVETIGIYEKSNTALIFVLISISIILIYLIIKR